MWIVTFKININTCEWWLSEKDETERVEISVSYISVTFTFL